MKCKISIDESWPVYFIDKVNSLDKESIFNIEVTDEFYKEYISVLSKYENLQKILQATYDECKIGMVSEYESACLP